MISLRAVCKISLRSYRRLSGDVSCIDNCTAICSQHLALIDSNESGLSGTPPTQRAWRIARATAPRRCLDAIGLALRSVDELWHREHHHDDDQDLDDHDHLATTSGAPGATLRPLKRESERTARPQVRSSTWVMPCHRLGPAGP